LVFNAVHAKTEALIMLWDEVGISVDGNIFSVLSDAVLQMFGCKIIRHWNLFCDFFL